MDESLLDAVFRDVSRADMDADPAVCFVLDEKLRLIYCNPSWDRFAEQNGAPHLRAKLVLGMAALDSTSGELFDYYRYRYHEVLADRRPRDHDFHCSSPEVERLMRMHIYRSRNAPALLISCSMRIERSHSGPSGEPIQDLYRNAQGVIVMCSNCRRTRRAAVEPETWDWVADFVRRMPGGVSHGLCNLCLNYYYPAEN
jgi:hypothetical protein